MNHPDTPDLATATTTTLSATRAQTAQQPRLHVGGWVRKPLALSTTDLDAMEWLAVPDFDVICTLDGSHGLLPTVRAVRLCDLVSMAAPAFELRTDFKRVAIVAEGNEGYRALFSWAEVFNSPLGGGIVVAYDNAAARLPGKAGPFAVLPRHDLATGPRYVRGLRSIELHKLW